MQFNKICFTFSFSVHTNKNSLKAVSSKNDIYQNAPAKESEQTYYGFGTESTEHMPETAILVKTLPDLVFSGNAATEKFQKEFEVKLI